MGTDEKILRFGTFEADERRFELRRRGQVVPIQRRVLDTIIFLARSGGRLIEHRDLIAGPWEGTVVSEAAIGQAIMHARRALEDPERPHPYIVTVRGKGFRWNDGAPLPAERHDPPAPWLAPAGPVEPGPSPLRVVSAAPSGMATEVGAMLLESLQASRRQLEAARRLEDPLRQLDALLASLQDLFALGRTAELDRLARQHARLAAKVAHPAHLWFGTVLESARQFRDGHVGRAAQLLTRNLESGRRALGAGADAVVATHLLNLALELTGNQRRVLLRRSADLATRAAARLTNPAPTQLIAAVARLHLGDRAGARRLFESGTFTVSTLPADHHLLPMLVNLSDLAIAFRDGPRLDAVYRRLSAHTGLQVRRDFADWGPVVYHLARAARELGLRQESRRLSMSSLEHSRRGSARPWKLWAACSRGVTLLADGTAADTRRALRLLEPTLAAARALRLPALTQAARASLDRARAVTRARPRVSRVGRRVP